VNLAGIPKATNETTDAYDSIDWLVEKPLRTTTEKWDVPDVSRRADDGASAAAAASGIEGDERAGF